MLNENRQVLASHRNAIIEVWGIDSTVWTFQKQRRASEVRIVGFIWRVQDVLGCAIAMKEMLVAADDEGSLRAEDATA